MRSLYFTLAAEGPTDQMLMPIVEWVLRQSLGPMAAVNGRFSPHSGTIDARILRAVHDFSGSDLLIVHADLDGRDMHTSRIAEVEAAVTELAVSETLPPHLVLVPVRESEAWLLFSEPAIRRAAANPKGKARLNLPARGFDRITDPKRLLNSALDAASGLAGRKLDKFKRDRRPIWVANEIDDFAPLRKLEAFIAFESAIAEFAARWTAEEE